MSQADEVTLGAALPPGQSKTKAEWAPPHRSDVQGLRGLAVLVVVLYHAGVVGFGGGYVGVDVFFALSGFVIGRLLLAELQATGRVDFRRFYIRRVRRLLPALSVALCAVLIASIGFAGVAAQRITARTGAAAGLMNANTYLALFGSKGGYFNVGAQENPLLHTWSLSVEEQFYLVFPVVVAGSWVLARRLRHRPERVVAAALIAICALSLMLATAVLAQAWNLRGHAREIAFYSMPTRAWEFAGGAVVALWAVHRSGGQEVSQARAQRRATGLAWTGIACVAVATLRFDDSTTFPGVAAALPVCGVLLVLIAGTTTAGTSSGTPVGAVLSWRPLTWIGDVSYGWYLWHWPAMVFAGAWWPATSHVRIVAGVASLGLAALSYRLVEQPMRRRRSSLRPAIALAAVCAILPLGAAAMLERSHHAIVRSAVYQTLGEHADRTGKCDGANLYGAPNGGLCTWDPAGASATGLAVLVGDSNAGHLSEGFIDAANTQRLSARISTLSGCPFVALPTDVPIGPIGCADHVNRTVEALVSLQPEIVVIASATDLHLGNIAWPVTETSRALDPRSARAAESWAHSLGELTGRLSEAGIAVVIVHPVPRMPANWSPRLFAPLRLQSPGSLADLAVERERQALSQQLARRLEASVAMSGVVALDPYPALCGTVECPAHDGVDWLYRDSAHLSVRGSEFLADDLSSAMSSATAATPG